MFKNVHIHGDNFNTFYFKTIKSRLITITKIDVIKCPAINIDVIIQPAQSSSK